jgi:DNA-binding response OmpR family regulator
MDHDAFTDMEKIGTLCMSQKIKPLALLIEDDDDIIAILRLFVEAEGYRTRVIYNGGEALDHIDSMIELPTIVILDVMLPGIDGLTVLERLRRRPIWAKVPVIMVTSCSEGNDVRRAMAGGANDYIVKPFHPRTLISRIQALLASPTHNYSGNFSKSNDPIGTDKEM